MRNDELLAHLRSTISRCAGFENDELSQDRNSALNSYHQRPNGTEIEGRSTYVSGDVSAAVESNRAAMLEAFKDERIAEFDALDGDDEWQAQLESDTVAQYIKSANGRWHIAQAIKETLRLRNGWL